MSFELFINISKEGDFLDTCPLVLCHLNKFYNTGVQVLQAIGREGSNYDLMHPLTDLYTMSQNEA